MSKRKSNAGEAIVIVDLQKAFEVPPKLIAAVRRYSRRFRTRVFTRFVNPAGSLFRTKLDQHSCAPGTPDLELWIEPEKTDLVLTKQGYGLSAAAIRKLRALGIKRATICGIDTDACVLGVMFSLFDAGIDCRVHKNLCWSSSGLHREAIKIIESQFPPPKSSGKTSKAAAR